MILLRSMIKKIIILLLLVAPACAWEIQSGNVTNMTESDLITALADAYSAGMSVSGGAMAKTMYSQHALSYPKLWENLNTFNGNIRDFNILLDKFDPAGVAFLRNPEFGL